MEPELSQQGLAKYLTIKFHENPSSVSRFVPCGRMYERTDGRTTDRETYTTNLIDKLTTFKCRLL